MLRQVMKFYILDGNTPVECKDFMVFGQWFETADRTVAKTEIGDIRVSTVFLGIDHSFCGGVPILFETMVFGLEDDEMCDRYSFWAEAVIGHKKTCSKVRERIGISEDITS